jgi:hypothetical protein
MGRSFSMIVSVSRRTDIPALYGEWFLQRIRAGYALVRNPMNRRQVSRIRLTPDAVDAFVFWTKNPRPFLAAVPLLERYPSYYQVTITPYGREVEQNVPDLEDAVDAFIRLAGLIGRDRTVWRYDPILFSGRYTADFHRRAFRQLAERLHPYTGKVVISFIDEYAKTKRNLRALDYRQPAAEERRELARALAATAAEFRLAISACSEPEDYSGCGVAAGSCVDPQLLEQLLGRELPTGRDRNQRTGCRCLPSVDLGAYDTCTHRCLYCYANASPGAAERNGSVHDPASPFLLGGLEEGDRITDRN